MGEKKNTGVFQLKNKNWGFRYVVMVDGVRKEARKTKDEKGNPLHTRKEAITARSIAIKNCKDTLLEKTNEEAPQKPARKTMAELYEEYCASGRKDKAYTTRKRQDSLWNNYISKRFGYRYIDEISIAEVNDYLTELYCDEGHSHAYVETFLRLFYLLFGQAFSRNYLDLDTYNKLCINKSTRIHMPKKSVEEYKDIIIFNKKQLSQLDKYFSGTNGETAYLIGRYCGLRISECYGLKWSDIDLEQGTITITKQMQYQDGLIKLVPLKTKCARRTIYLSKRLQTYLTKLKKQTKIYEVEFAAQRKQNQTIIIDSNGKEISSLEMVNTMPNGKLQTVNSMKYHAMLIRKELGFDFNYHYLRHTYGTLLAEMNTPAHILCNQMGHANSRVTEKYYLAVSERGIDTLTKNLNHM